MADHGSRDHAAWSASATDRNWNCAGALTLSAQYPDAESEAAAWGTACHQVSEKCLRGGMDPWTFIGTIEKTKAFEIEVDDEMAECAEVYVDYVRAAAERGLGVQIEQRFSLDALRPPFDAGGTADAVVYFDKECRLEVIDLKGGRGVVVEAKGNPQLRTYALGAMIANAGLDVTHVTTTVVQPRAGHKDGCIRSETFHIADLVDWTTDLLAAMRRAQEAADAFADTPRAAWAAKHLSAGAHCKFCKAAGACPALERAALDAAGVWFDDLDAPRLANAPDELSPDELSKRLDLVDMIEDWISAVRAHAHSQAEHGVAIPNYILVAREGRRSWAADDAKVADDLVSVVGLSSEQIYARKLLSPAQIERVLGKKRIGEIANMWHRPTRGTNLVRATKTTRPATVPDVQKHFTALE